jgi:uncharacterized protein DUF5995
LPLQIPVSATIDDVLHQMRQIETLLPTEHGAQHFNRMYLRVTEAVNEASGTTLWEHEEFIPRLDVTFANLYFHAVEQYLTGEKVDPAWRPLFEVHRGGQPAPIQYALAGMNAHINHDLPVAVITTCKQMELEPHEKSPAHRDYTRTNDVLREVETRIKDWFVEGWIAELDEAMGKIDDALAMWSISTAREIAWENAQVLWLLGDHPGVERIYRRTLGRMVKFAGRGILL